GAARPPVWTPNIAPKCRFDNRVSQTLRLIEPFVGFVESGHRNVEDSEFADGAVAATGLYVNGRHRLNRKDFPVEFNMAVAFEHYVNLGGFLVIMRSRILLDIDDVHAGCSAR